MLVLFYMEKGGEMQIKAGIDWLKLFLYFSIKHLNISE